MFHRLKALPQAIRSLFTKHSNSQPNAQPELFAHDQQQSRRPVGLDFSTPKKVLKLALIAAAIGGVIFVVIKQAPLRNVNRGEMGVRVNHLTGGVSEWRDGSVFVLPGLHSMRVYSLRDQTYRAAQASTATGPAPLQSIEGLSLGADIAVRYALDPAKASAVARNLPDNLNQDIVDPALQSVIYKVFSRYTVREIFSTKRSEIQQTIEADLAPLLAHDGLALRSVHIGKIDLPEDYKRGMEGLLAEELASEKMRFTLELQEKRSKESQIEAEAEKARREIAAEAAAREQIIAAKAQEEAMKHVLPFKQRQIEQRQLEAEAERIARVKAAEGSAQARRIEANGEADARQKLAEAEAFRMDKVGKINAEQMAREGALVTKHPLLIQKTLADKLSDKIQVIIAPPPSNGDFIGATLLGASKPSANSAAQATAPVASEETASQE